MVDGIGSDGRINCKKIVNNDSDVQTLINTLAETCATGQKIKAQWDNNDKKFKMVCEW
jgi:hypothetical protein